MSSLGKCARCNKTVYNVEGFTAVKKCFHRSCFKCKVCNWQLTLTSYKSINDEIYCANHYPVNGFSNQGEQRCAEITNINIFLFLDAPKLDTVNNQVRGEGEKPNTGVSDLVTANALKAPKLDTVNNQVRGDGDKPNTGVNDLVTANALKAPKLDVVNQQIYNTSGEKPSIDLETISINKATSAPKLDVQSGYQKTSAH
ncbi:hypothetical protein DICPUDRAFT_32515 [Dictyostelium purpureum]|uniref:LIM zinc-binding domain-containing protein n=1 Tax=Dictyostelium purpureum TaxID=5786 RepID=F0ZJ50_DICPU|nr:uncharacterized protein DICPUDRAFT_32515 [Dictyostelium purpureum]EGC36014.1 hypothetical protein DICPUDRAFT_32515 [Dictyostelium purpureum]|eukprot:XP_003287452.1 hypothetical protein DICPUDRAFT_32515 [Dictyostelium purpureum]